MKDEARQEGFFISQDGSTFRRHAKKGDKEVRPKKKKVKKQPSDQPTPIEEIRQFNRAIIQRAKILENYGSYEDVDGNVYKLIDGKWSLIGDDFRADLVKTIQSDHPEFPAIPQLSPIARWLKNKIETKKKERGPLQASPLPGPGNFDAFGKPLKK